MTGTRTDDPREERRLLLALLSSRVTGNISTHVNTYPVWVYVGVLSIPGIIYHLYLPILLYLHIKAPIGAEFCIIHREHAVVRITM